MNRCALARPCRWRRRRLRSEPGEAHQKRESNFQGLGSKARFEQTGAERARTKGFFPGGLAKTTSTALFG